MHDGQGVQLAAPSETSYLHGGYGQLLDALERALDRRYGEAIAAGMEVEEDSRVYIVTDVAGGKVVLDANHPFAGMALRFFLEVLKVRAAKPEEIAQGVSLP